MIRCINALRDYLRRMIYFLGYLLISFAGELVGVDFDIVDQDVRIIYCSWKFIGELHLTVDDELDVVSAWLQLKDVRESAGFRAVLMISIGNF